MNSVVRHRKTVPKEADKWLPNSNHRIDESGYLIKIEPLKKMIECALTSPYIKNEKTISLPIVACMHLHWTPMTS